MALLLTAGSPSISGQSVSATSSPFIVKGIACSSLERVSSIASIEVSFSSGISSSLLSGAASMGPVISGDSCGSSTWTCNIN